MLAPDLIDSKLKEYEQFVNNTLKPDLKTIETTLGAKVQEHKRWQQVKQVVGTMREFRDKDRDMTLRVPLGCGVHVSGEVSDFNRVFVDIGLGLRLEMDLEEASKYSEIRMRTLGREIEHQRHLAVSVKVNIKMVLLAINELGDTKS